jgi:hypothetical protein
VQSNARAGSVSRERLEAAGKSEEMKELASAGIAATKAITEVNKALDTCTKGRCLSQ